MKEDLIEKIKGFHLKLCLCILVFVSLGIFLISFKGDDQCLPWPWWFLMLYGWCGLVVAIKFSEYSDKEK